MRTIQTVVYTYDELSDSAKEKAREGYLENFDFDFHSDWTIDVAKEIGKLLGINIDKIYYSGSWSWGGGVSFKGHYNYKKGSVKAVEEYAPEDKELHRIAKALQLEQKKYFYKLVASIKPGRFYDNSSCMIVSVEHDDDAYKNIGDSETKIKELLIDFADWIYDKLEEEYNYQTSNEVVVENILANEYEFTEDGEIL